MNRWFAPFSLFFCFAARPAFAVVFDPGLCKDAALVAAEMVEYHLSGALWQAKVSSCLDQSRFKTILAEHITAGEGPEEPELLIPKGAKVEVLSRKSFDRGAMEVKFQVRHKKGGKEFLYRDSLTFLWNPEIVRKDDGCAIPEESPKKFALREECQRGNE